MATLHEIVTYRKQANWNWTESEFMGLVGNKIQAVAALHNNKIVHRNIRPHNILYSGYKSAYVLTNYKLAKILTRKQNETHAIVGVPYYANP
jgi:serine/threonine protein kinase